MKSCGGRKVLTHVLVSFLQARTEKRHPKCTQHAVGLANLKKNMHTL